MKWTTVFDYKIANVDFQLVNWKMFRCFSQWKANCSQLGDVNWWWCTTAALKTWQERVQVCCVERNTDVKLLHTKKRNSINGRLFTSKVVKNIKETKKKWYFLSCPTWRLKNEEKNSNEYCIDRLNDNIEI